MDRHTEHVSEIGAFVDHPTRQQLSAHQIELVAEIRALAAALAEWQRRAEAAEKERDCLRADRNRLRTQVDSVCDLLTFLDHAADKALAIHYASRGENAVARATKRHVAEIRAIIVGDSDVMPG